jgi:hypothetical protein
MSLVRGNQILNSPDVITTGARLSNRRRGPGQRGVHPIRRLPNGADFAVPRPRHPLHGLILAAESPLPLADTLHTALQASESAHAGGEKRQQSQEVCSHHVSLLHRARKCPFERLSEE